MTTLQSMWARDTEKERLRASLTECLPLIGWAAYSDSELQREHELGNGKAQIILRARRALGQQAGPEVK